MMEHLSDIEQLCEAEYLEPDCTEREIRAFRDGWNCAWRTIMDELKNHIGKNDVDKE